MIDSRTPLKTQNVIKIGEKDYYVSSLVGKGSNCLVYDASYKDSMGENHAVRMKEFFPVYLNMKRNLDNSIYCSEFEAEDFKRAKQEFERMYKKNVLFRQKNGLVNSTSNAMELVTSNNTLYVIVAFDEGSDYSSYQDQSVLELLKHIRAISKVLKNYHQNQYLHLDIKPENIFVIPETAEHVILFDFDSVVSLEELKEDSMLSFSYSTGFSAPEQVMGKTNSMGYHTDIYSVGALLFFKLFNRVPMISDTQLGAIIHFEECRYDISMLPKKLERLMRKFIKKTLSVSYLARWRDMDEVISCLNEMIPLADDKSFSIRDNFNYNERYFIGRQQELERVSQYFDDSNVVFISGIGGIGKTELAKYYACKYRKEYDTIVFLPYLKSLKDTITSDALIINNLDFTNETQNEQYEKN